MNILFVINALDVGGAETFLMRLMKELYSQKHRTFIYILEPTLNNASFEKTFFNETKAILVKGPKQHKIFQSFLFYKINALLLRFGHEDYYKKHLRRRTSRYFKRLLKDKYHIEIINSHLHSSDIFASEFLKPLLNIPHIITMQGCYESVISLNDKDATERATAAILNCDGLTYVAEKNLNFLNLTNTPVPYINKKIYNGLSEPDKNTSKNRKDYNISENDFVIGQVSRSIESKGMEIAAKAVEYLIEEKDCKNLKLIIVGPENDYYKELKSKYSIKNYILFPGSTNNAIEWITLFDIGILPTYFPSESCPSSIIEYLACGKPVISTYIGEIPRMIEVGDKKAGTLVHFDKDNGKPLVMEIADSIMTYFNDKALYKEHSGLAKEAFSKFEIKKIAENYLDIYKNVLTKSQK